MATVIRKAILPIMATELGGESTLPKLCDINPGGVVTNIEVTEDDELWMNFDSTRTSFPYKDQDCYSRDLTIEGVPCVELENEHLKAVFTPQYGGKLWSLFDKDEGKELLFANHVFRPAYLALRNAWTSGGVEWNCGAFQGHHPYTCSPLFACILSEKESGIGCPVLRMYSYERIREVTRQMDFYLPDGSKVLYCRMRVVNDNLTRRDMYWWSNIAVKTDPDARVIVPSDCSYNPYLSLEPWGDKDKEHTWLPIYKDIDITYPVNSPVAVDYFYKTYKDRRHYVSHIGKDGYGFVQFSTERLKGRKLFVWGNTNGGINWQDFLSGDDGRGNYCDGRYCEIQCGLAGTQYECLPMPPKTAWEWIECYGAIKTDPSKAHGDWHGAQREVESKLDEIISMDGLEAELKRTHEMALTPCSDMVCVGDGWAALENMRREKNGVKCLSSHLDFGSAGSDQQMWISLLNDGVLKSPCESDTKLPPESYMSSDYWISLLEKSVFEGAGKDSWLSHYELGCSYLASGKVSLAKSELNKSAEINKNAWNMYALSELYGIEGNAQLKARTMREAYFLSADDISLCKMTCQALFLAKLWDELISFTDEIWDKMQDVPRVRFFRCVALCYVGRLEESEEILMCNGGLKIPDMKEGETYITSFWYDLMEAKAKKEGKPFDREKESPPKIFDFRMNYFGY